MTENTDLSLLGFPDKLWYLVNEPKCEQLQWNFDGTSIIIPNNNEFVSKVLNNPSKVLFKTKNFSSFVRQLNLYGFRKVSEHRKVGQTHIVSTNRSEFKHPCFLKDRRDLLEDVKRKASNTRREQSPDEEKSHSANNLDFQMQRYGPVNSGPPAVGGFWANWDPVFCPIPWMPYGATAGIGYTISSGPQYETQGFYGKDGLPYYVPSHTPLASPAAHSKYDFCSVINGNRAMTNDHVIPPSTSVTFSCPQSTSPSVKITCSVSPDGNDSNCDHGNVNVDIDHIDVTNGNISVCRLQEEAKKPIPTTEVSTTSNGILKTDKSTGLERDLKEHGELKRLDHDRCSVIQDYKRLRFMKNNAD